MKKSNYKKGKKGEGIAEKYLQDTGHKVVEKNYSTKFGEIDLITVKNKTIRFVEVKTKVGETFGAPEEMIDLRKIRQVMRLGEAYMIKNQLISRYESSQVDAVCIVFDSQGNKVRLDYYENLTADLWTI